MDKYLLTKLNPDGTGEAVMPKLKKPKIIEYAGEPELYKAAVIDFHYHLSLIPTYPVAASGLKIGDWFDADEELQYRTSQDEWKVADTEYYESLRQDYRRIVLLPKVRGNESTVGQLITAQIKLHELNWKVVSKEIGFTEDFMWKLMYDNIYSNSIPVVLFRNLILSLHIPLSTIIPVMRQTFKLLKSKETEDDIKKKPNGYMLWENEESLEKYIARLKDLFTPSKK